MELNQRLEEINRIRTQLDELAGDEFAARYELEKQLDELKRDLPSFDKDAGRSREDLETELRERRLQLDRLLHDAGVSLAPMSDGAGGSGDAATVAMRQAALEAGDIDGIRRRIGELESALTKLGGD